MRYNEPKRGLFSRLAEAGSAGLGIAAQNVIPFHQYNQRQQQDQQDRASLDQYRQQQLEVQRQNAERQAQADQMQGFYGMAEAYLKQKPQEPYIPKSINEGMAYGIATGDQGMISQFSPYWGQQNSVENRPVREVTPKMPTNYVQKFNSRMGDLQNNYDYRNAQGFAPNPYPEGEKIFKQEFEPGVVQEGLNVDSVRTLAGLPVGTPRLNVHTSPGAVPMPPPDWPGSGEEWMDYLNRKRGQ